MRFSRVRSFSTGDPFAASLSVTACKGTIADTGTAACGRGLILSLWTRKEATSRVLKRSNTTCRWDCDFELQSYGHANASTRFADSRKSKGIEKPCAGVLNARIGAMELAWKPGSMGAG